MLFAEVLNAIGDAVIPISGTTMDFKMSNGVAGSTARHRSSAWSSYYDVTVLCTAQLVAANYVARFLGCFLAIAHFRRRQTRLSVKDDVRR
jgi:hypothetical protein